VYVKKKDKTEKEIYEMFSRFGIDEKELDYICNESIIDRKKSWGIVYDVFLYAFIKIGFDKQHLGYLSRRAKHKHKFRAKELFSRINYLKYIINNKR
jgi:hypothetical protein